MLPSKGAKRTFPFSSLLTSSRFHSRWAFELERRTCRLGEEQQSVLFAAWDASTQPPILYTTPAPPSILFRSFCRVASPPFSALSPVTAARLLAALLPPWNPLKQNPTHRRRPRRRLAATTHPPRRGHIGHGACQAHTASSFGVTLARFHCVTRCLFELVTFSVEGFERSQD